MVADVDILSDMDLSHIVEQLQPLAVPIDSLKKDPQNARTHGDENLSGIAESLRAYKQRKPIVVNARTMIVEAGNGTIDALKQLGHSMVAAVMVDDDPLTATGYSVADNRTAELAEWDQGQLVKLFKDLEGSDLPTGFTSEQILLAFEGLEPPPGEEPPEPGGLPPDPVSEIGQVYQLGPHRVMCGDSTQRAHVELLMGGERARLVLTDPPYGIAYVGKTKKELTIKNDALTPEATEELWSSALALACSFAVDGSVVYAFTSTSPHTLASTLAGASGSGFGIRHMLAWNKDAFALDRSDYHYKHEGIFYGWKPGAAHFFVKDRAQSTVLDYPRPKRNAEHPTMKPVGLLERLIRNSSLPEWKVYDPFTGSGSTLIACARTRRTFFGMELDPRYVDVIRKRYGDYERQLGLEVGSDSL